MRLVQCLMTDGRRRVAAVSEDEQRLHLLTGFNRVYDLALAAIRLNSPLIDAVASCIGKDSLDYEGVIRENRILPPLDHPDPAHCLVTGTGLTHLGSAQSRNAMHNALQRENLTDSMRMFQLGLDGGKPTAGQIGSEPEWFYKGDGRCVVPSGQPLVQPPFAQDGGEEAELVGLYIIDDDGQVRRVGFSLGNEFSDHVLEKQNYLYLAHSKLRPCAVGPAVSIAPLPDDIRGQVCIRRHGEIIWGAPFLTGEANMSHSIANLEHHHFKYQAFRRPGDVHLHFFGAAVLSFSDQIKPEHGDVFEISAPPFGRPLQNPLHIDPGEPRLINVKAL